MTDHTNSDMSEGDWGETELDPQEQRDAEVNLDDPTAGDSEPWSPPDRQPRGAELVGNEGTETIDQRIAQEEPEQGTAYGAPSPAGEAYDQPDAAPETVDDLDLRDVDLDGVDEFGGPDLGGLQDSGPEFSAMSVVDEDDIDAERTTEDVDGDLA